MGKLHYLTALLLIILLAVVSGWVFESIEEKPVLTKEKIRHDPDYFLKNFTATTMDVTGKPAYQVKANYLEHYPDDDSMHLTKPFFLFYKDNQKSWTAQANAAQILNNSEIIHLKGEVVLNNVLNSSKNNEVMLLTAEQLTIEPERNIAHTESKIKLNKGTSYIQALGMRVDMDKNKIEFLSNTRSHYVLPAE
ncbi:MAG: LPS export ABC transporter periplasmic protein LptC [Gammaproteobacteria bacterium]|nr:LPS export ABC transporter periplasmic protein LptC [Gammaproteobacteria bacterium]